MDVRFHRSHRAVAAQLDVRVKRVLPRALHTQHPCFRSRAADLCAYSRKLWLVRLPSPFLVLGVL